ncbi:MAG TPA: hypothetical protein VNJ02_20235 [Vicinamibacterales bacterium]|nr:hypothetical protein [Vicinamibacterales bacterium]
MPVLFALGLILFVLLAMIALLPLALVQRYRVGTARTLARRWLVSINLVGVCVSLLSLLLGAALSNIWIPRAFVAALVGALVGAALGAVGLAMTRWERSAATLHYTPNQWLVLTITLAVTARLLYGLWRLWQVWQTGAVSGDWLVDAGAAGSIAAGAVVLGYYAVFWFGVRRRT